MCDIPVFYATTEGQTRRIAEGRPDRLREHGFRSEAIRIGSQEAAELEWDRIGGVCLGASLHVQRHQRRAIAFAKEHREQLARLPSLFFSVSLAAASKQPEERAQARRIAEGFAAETGWQPDRIACVAGRLAYTRYGWLKRWILRRIALKEGGSGDTSRDHEYTDWSQVTTLADDLARELQRRKVAAAQPA